MTKLTPYGPGKFGLKIDAYVHSLSLDGADDEIGDVDEYGQHCCLISGPFAPTDSERERFGLSADDCAFLAQHVGAVLREDRSGFVGVEWFATAFSLGREWAGLAREWEQYLDADGGE